MDDITKAVIEEHLNALVDILAPIGPEFSLGAADEDGNDWTFHIKLEGK